MAQGASASSKLDFYSTGRSKQRSAGVPPIALLRNPLIAAVLRFAAGLRFPALFAIACALFLLDLLIPDFIPFADELLLGLVALMLGSLKRPKPPPGTATD